MKQKDVPIYEKKILAMLPITQMEIWKTLNMSSQDSSDIIELMLKKHLIKRTKVSIGGRKTFRIEKLNGHKPRKDYSPLINKLNTFAPCTGCTILECSPIECHKLSDWICVPQLADSKV